MATKKPEPKKQETRMTSQKVGITEQRPAWLAEGNRGSERVETADLIIPRLEVVQSLSPARQKDKPEYIKGAEEGAIFNNVTREVYPRPVLFCPVYFRKDYLIWKDRKKGGGFRGAYPNMVEAQTMLDSLEDSSDHAIIDTPQHFGVIIREDGKMDQVVISMPRTKAKISRRFNSLIRMHGGEDRWARAYYFDTTFEKNPKGEFYNFTVRDGGYVTEEVYTYAEQMYNDVKAGKAAASTKFEDDNKEDDDF